MKSACSTSDAKLLESNWEWIGGIRIWTSEKCNNTWKRRISMLEEKWTKKVAKATFKLTSRKLSVEDNDFRTM